MDTKNMLTVPEVAERLGLSAHQVYRRLSRGDIPSELGGARGQQYLVDAEVLEDYIAAGQPLSMAKRERSMLGVPEVARMTGFTVEAVRKMCETGKFEYERGAGKNGHYRIKRSSVDAYMTRHFAA